MTTTNFCIKYDGPALENHVMDVRELAPALLHLGKLIELANELLDPNAPKAQVSVHGSFKKGSFAVELIANYGGEIWNGIKSVFTGSNVAAVLGIVGVLEAIGLMPGDGLIGLIKRLRGRGVVTIKYENNIALVVTDDGEEIETSLVAANLYQDKGIRVELEGVLSPLEKQGVTYFVSGKDLDDMGTVTIVTRDEFDYFKRQTDLPNIISDRLDENIMLQIESPKFKNATNKWEVTDGTTSFFVLMNDEEFQGRVDSGEERFGKGDILMADLRRVQKVLSGELKTEYIIEKVHEHKAPLQMKFY